MRGWKWILIFMINWDIKIYEFKSYSTNHSHVNPLGPSEPKYKRNKSKVTVSAARRVGVKN